MQFSSRLSSCLPSTETPKLVHITVLLMETHSRCTGPAYTTRLKAARGSIVVIFISPGSLGMGHRDWKRAGKNERQARA